MNPTENPYATKVELVHDAIEMHHVDQEFIDKYDFSQHECIDTIFINGDDVRTLRIPDGQICILQQDRLTEIPRFSYSSCMQ